MTLPIRHGPDSLISHYVAEDPHLPGPADARLIGSGVAVWAIIGHLPAAGNDPHRVAQDYEIEPEAVRAALAYYARHRAAIDARLATNAV